MKSTKNMTGKPSGAYNSRASGSGGPTGNAGKVKTISAPTKPKMASMKSAHGKLIPGNC